MESIVKLQVYHVISHLYLKFNPPLVKNKDTLAYTIKICFGHLIAYYLQLNEKSVLKCAKK